MAATNKNDTFTSHDIIDIDDENYFFTPAISHATRLAIGRSPKLSDYLDIRSHFASYALKAQKDYESGEVKYDNYLTSYYETDSAIADRIGITRIKCNEWISELCKIGLVVRLPYASDGMSRRNLVVLDYGLKSYIPVLKHCLVILEAKLIEARKKGKARGSGIAKSIRYINDAIVRHPNIEGKPHEKVPAPEAALVQPPEDPVPKPKKSSPFVVGLVRDFNKLNPSLEFNFDPESNLYVLSVDGNCIENFKNTGEARNYLNKECRDRDTNNNNNNDAVDIGW